MVSAGAALVASRHPRIQQVIALAGMLAATIVGVFLIFGAAQGPVVLDVGSWATAYGPDDSTDTLYHIKGYWKSSFYSVIVIMEGAEVTVSYGCPDGFLYQHPTWKEIRGA